MAADDLAAKLTRYARLYHYTLPGDADGAPLWVWRYPVFPTVLAQDRTLRSSSTRRFRLPDRLARS